MAITTRDVMRLDHIKGRMEELIEEAKDLVRSANRDVYNRAKGYWIASIITALSKEHEYLGGSGYTMEETINELQELVEDEFEEVEEEDLDDPEEEDY